MKRKSYNPYKIKVRKTAKFSGVANPENELTLKKEHVGFSSNVVSFRVGELNNRCGQIMEDMSDD